MIKYEIFAFGSTAERIEKGRNILLDQVQEFVNEKGEDKIISIAGLMNAVVVWYKE